MYIQYNTTQPQKRMKYCHLQQCRWTQRVLPSEIRQIPCIDYTWNLKSHTNACKYRNRLIDIENKLMVIKGGGRDKLGVLD